MRPGFLLGQRVHLLALVIGEGLQGAQGQLGSQRQRHPRGQQRVAPEQGHEPRRAGGDHVAVGCVGSKIRSEPEVVIAPGDRSADIGIPDEPHRQFHPPVAVSAGRLGVVQFHVGREAADDVLIVDRRRRDNRRRPLASGRSGEAVSDVVAGDTCTGGVYPKPPLVAVPFRLDHELITVHLQVLPPLVGDGVAFDLEEIGEIRADLEVECARDRLPRVIAYHQLLSQTGADAARALNDERRVEHGRTVSSRAQRRRHGMAHKSSRQGSWTGWSLISSFHDETKRVSRKYTPW